MASIYHTAPHHAHTYTDTPCNIQITFHPHNDAHLYYIYKYIYLHIIIIPIIYIDDANTNVYILELEWSRCVICIYTCMRAFTLNFIFRVWCERRIFSTRKVIYLSCLPRNAINNFGWQK